MKSMTLVAKHLYFGMDPLNLRDAANRVVARLPEDTTVRPVVRLDALVEDFRLTAGASRALVDQLVADGVLQPLSDRGADFEVTTRMREIARARIIEPLPRTEAQRLLARCVELAKRFNRTATRNKYEIEELAVYGAYMSRDADLSDLMLGLTGRRRAPGQTPLHRPRDHADRRHRAHSRPVRAPEHVRQGGVLPAPYRHAAAVRGGVPRRGLTVRQRRMRPSFPITVRSTYFDPLWSDGVYDT